MAGADKSTIKYGCAYDASEQIINIDQAVAKQHYTCLSCGNKLTPVVNVTKKQQHFRHSNSDQTRACSPETYLHKLAKQVFYEAYKDCKKRKAPFTITYKVPQVCNSCKYGPCKDILSTHREVNLLSHFPNAFPPDTKTSEKSNYRPDVMLMSDSGEELWIEIAVTHKAEQNKLDTGTRIVEIDITNESDATSISSQPLSESDRVRIYNFKRKPCEADLREKCPKQMWVFKLYKNGFNRVTCDVVYKFATTHNDKVALAVPLDSDGKRSFPIIEQQVKHIESAFKKGLTVSHCILCSHSALTQASTVFCLKTRKNIRDTIAIVSLNCRYYDPAATIPSEGGFIGAAKSRWAKYQAAKENHSSKKQLRASYLPVTSNISLFKGYAKQCKSCGVSLFVDDSGDYFPGTAKLTLTNGLSITVVAIDKTSENPLENVNCPDCGTQNCFHNLPRMILRNKNIVD